ncbi:radical SAM/SPASM domain-containing protein [Calothrix sp. UHCC 0171]|uniref:radical SAM/SPASM domain-containing protein n=1 Tax=Calothrix sp. UHCC 0171 TaxID=3110245 RepID=UPI002B1EC077|nr:radical SAM protein [Calothrix sp. UHCC 0171]MEA5571329.1 radical SAM protein [Calothrix sp. UHCC 0171]
MTQETKKVQFVVKTSKHCNLRCRYCYEYAELGNKNAIALAQIEKMFTNIANYYQNLEFPIEIEFVWHGGEPLLQKPDFYWQVFDLQKKIFNYENIRIRNGVQTNLTLLDSQRLKLLKSGFDGVGVSLDLFGGLRVYQTGIESQNKVLENIDKLTDANIDFGCISVLTKQNLDFIPEIYSFYREMNLSARILPLFKGSFENQHQGFEITAYEVLEAYKKLVDLWLADDKFVWISPIYEAIKQVIYHYSPNAPTSFYDKREWESIYIVDVDGEVYSYADAYAITHSHGNIFNQPLAALISSSQHQKIIREAEERIQETCSQCKFFGSCSGYPIAEGNRQYNEINQDGSINCIVDKGIRQYIEYRLFEMGIIDVERGTITLDKFNVNSQSSPSLAYI